MRGRGARHLLLHRQFARISRRWQGEWTHLNETQTAPKMVDISLKTPSLRTAHAM